MKIIFDKPSEDFKYEISSTDIKKLFRLIPELTRHIKLVHIQAQEPNKSRFERPVRFEGLSNKINISAKGLNKISIIRELLIEIISENGSDLSLRPASYRRLTKEQMKKIEPIIFPTIESFKKTDKEIE